MRIINDWFHDYYDVVQATGQDLTIVYVRKPEEVAYQRASDFPFPKLEIGSAWNHGRELWTPRILQNIVGFCGKIYPVLRLDGDTAGSAEQRRICFNLTDIDRHMEAVLKPTALAEYRLKRRKGKGYFWTHNRYYSPHAVREVFERFFTKCEEARNDFEYVFVDHKCPLFVASRDAVGGWLSDTGLWLPDRGKIVYNGRLKDLEFFRLFDPATAFQELSMYFGNIAQPGRPVPEVSDRDLITAKSFNEWSFRNEPKNK